VISPDALVVAGATVFVLGAQQWFMHRQNRREYKRWMQLLSFLLEEYSLHRHEKDGSISYPRIKLGSAVNGKMRGEEYT